MIVILVNIYEPIGAAAHQNIKTIKIRQCILFNSFRGPRGTFNLGMLVFIFIRSKYIYTFNLFRLLKFACFLNHLPLNLGLFLVIGTFALVYNAHMILLRIMIRIVNDKCIRCWLKFPAFQS